MIYIYIYDLIIVHINIIPSFNKHHNGVAKVIFGEIIGLTLIYHMFDLAMNTRTPGTNLLRTMIKLI